MRKIRNRLAGLSVLSSMRIYCTIILYHTYSCKYSRRDYTQHQLLTFLLFKEYRKEDYRTLIRNLKEMDRIQDLIGLTTIPHFTTLQKTLCRIKSLYFDLLLKSILKQAYSDVGTISVTAIGTFRMISPSPKNYSDRFLVRKYGMTTSTTISIPMNCRKKYRSCSRISS
jgi:hypothetical protein